MRTAQDIQHEMKVTSAEDMNKVFAKMRGKRFKPGAVTGEPVRARVENDRLLADCECRGAEYVDPDDLRFFCHSCDNKSNGGAYRPIELPEVM